MVRCGLLVLRISHLTLFAGCDLAVSLMGPQLAAGAARIHAGPRPVFGAEEACFHDFPSLLHRIRVLRLI